MALCGARELRLELRRAFLKTARMYFGGVKRGVPQQGLTGDVLNKFWHGLQALALAIRLKMPQAADARAYPVDAEI
jgi:hypothetical protein